MKTALATPKNLVCLLLAVAVVLAFAGNVWALGTPGNPAAGSTFDQRLAQRKQEQNEQLDAKTQKHLQQVCINQQNAIRLLQNSTTAMITNRNTTYQKIDGIVWVSIGQLKLASLDTFTLEQDRGILSQKMSAFQTTATNYQQSLGDVLVINCQADVVGFQALLDTARAYYKQLSAESVDIHDYTVNTVQPALQNFITQLQPKTSGGQ